MASSDNSVNIKLSTQGAREVQRDLDKIASEADKAAKSVKNLIHNLFEISNARKGLTALNQDMRTAAQDIALMSRHMALSAQQMEKMSKGALLAAKQTKNLGNESKKTAKNVTVMSSSMKRFAKSLITVAAIKKSIEAIDSYRKSINSLSVALNTNAGAANKTMGQLSNSADELSVATGKSVIEIKKLQTEMLSFRNVSGDVFDKAVQGALDISEKFGTSATSAAKALGKALESPGKSLERLTSVGVKFTDAEKKVLKAMTDVGKAAEAQALIMDRLEKSVGGAAEASKPFVSNLTLAADYLKKLGSTTLNFLSLDVWKVSENIVNLREQLSELNSVIDQMDSSGSDNQALQEQLLIREKLLVDLKEQILLETELRGAKQETIDIAHQDLQFTKNNLKGLEDLLGKSQEVKKGEEDVLAIKGKQQEAADKLKEGTTELIDGLGLMNDKSKKFLTVMQSVGKIFGAFGSSSKEGGGGFWGSLGKLFGFAKGGAFNGGVQFMANGGILNSPTLFGTKSGLSVAGEAGPEAVLPLTRGSNGKLGVQASGAGMSVQVFDQRSGGAPVDVQQDENGVRITIRDEVKRMFTTGQMDRTMSQQFALNRVGSYR